MNNYPTQLDEIDQWLFDSFSIVAGACSSTENLRHTTARMIAEALWPDKDHIVADSKKASGDSIISKDLEEAAELCQQELYGGYYSGHIEAYKKAFKAGANWQREQDKETIELAEDHALLAGRMQVREEMLKDAIEARVFESSNPISEEGTNYHTISLLYDETPNMPHIICGDIIKFYIFENGIDY